jgi:hypothetical protein
MLPLLDILRLTPSLARVTAIRSRWFAFLAVFLWATAGALAVDRCACEDLASSCEHAGKACAQADDCSDCIKPVSSAVLVQELVALAPQAKSQLFLPSCVGVSEGVRLRWPAEVVHFQRSALFVPLRPPALRAGTICLRV